MEKAKKITKRERYAQLLAIAEVGANEELVEFINHEVELLNRKNASGGEKKLTPAQIANENLKNVIKNVLVEDGGLMTVSDLMKANAELGEFSNQKISRLANDMAKAGLIKKVEEGRKSYFKFE